MAPPAQPAAVAADDRAYAPRFATERALGVLAAWLEGAVATAVVAGAPGAGTTFVLRTVERRERGRRHVLFSPFLHIEPEALERWLGGLALGSPPGSLDAWLAGAPDAPSLLIVDEAHAATPAALEALARLREVRAPHLRICLGGCAGPALECAARSVGAADTVVVELPPWSAEELRGFAETLCALPPPGVEPGAPLAAVDPAALTAAAEGSPGLLRDAWSALRDLGTLPMAAATVVMPAARTALSAAPVATPAVAPIQTSTPEALWTRAPSPVTPPPLVAKPEAPAVPEVPATPVVTPAAAPAPDAPEVPAPESAAQEPLPPTRAAASPLVVTPAEPAVSAVPVVTPVHASAPRAPEVPAPQPASREPLPPAREPLPPAREPLPPAREPLPPARVAPAPRPPPPVQVPPLRWRAPWYNAAALGIGFALGFVGGWQGWENWEAPAAAPEVLPEATPPAAVASAPPAEPTPPLTYHDVQVNARPWAWIQIDGRPVGVTPLVHRDLASGEHEFEATFPDGRQQRRTVAIGPDSRFVSFQD